MAESGWVMFDWRTMKELPYETGPNGEGPVFVTKRTLANLAEQIAIAAMDSRDPTGLRIYVRGDISELEEIALKVIGEWAKAPAYRLPDSVDV